MEEKIINAEQVVETAEDIIVNADSNNMAETLAKFGTGAVIAATAGYAAYKIYKYLKLKKQQKAAVPEEDQSDENDIPVKSDEE